MILLLWESFLLTEPLSFPSNPGLKKKVIEMSSLSANLEQISKAKL